MVTINGINLIKLRSLGRNLTENRKRAIGELGLVLVAPTVAVSKREYLALKPWDRYTVRVMAVATSTRKAVLSGFAAAAAMGIRYLRPPRTNYQVELTLPGQTSPSAKNNWGTKIRYLYGSLPKEHYINHNNQRVTTIERTYVDILRLYGARYALIFIEGAMNQLGITKSEVIARVQVLGDSVWVRKAVALLRLAYGNSQSVYETLARFKLVNAQIPSITSIIPQARIRCGRINYYADLLINNWLILEVDGGCKYETNTLPVLLQERQRERELLRQGYGILRIKAADIDEYVVKEVTRYLNNASRVQVLAA